MIHKHIIAFVLGLVFAGILLSAEVFSWYRIQEMFHFQNFHMYGLIATAVGVLSIGLLALRHFGKKWYAIQYRRLKPKKIEWKRNILGGLLFGMGWALGGACSAPIYLWFGLAHKSGLPMLSGALFGAFLCILFDKKNRIHEYKTSKSQS